MLGFGPLGSAPLGAIPTRAALTADMLQTVVTTFVEKRLLSHLPKVLHHYTSLGTAQAILEYDDVRLSHAEYSNDQMEMAQAKAVIAEVLDQIAQGSPFAANLKRDFVRRRRRA